MDPPKINQRAEKRTLREKMRGLGLGYDQIAAEFARRYRLRPRTAWREAYGWSLVEAAQRINDWKGQAGLDPDGVATMTGARLCEHEQWPGPGPQPTGRKPTPRLLALLAAVYRCPVLDLVDLADREHLPAADLLVLDTYHPSPADRADEPISPPATLQQQTPARPPAAEIWPGTVEPRPPAICLTSVPATVPAVPAYRWFQQPEPQGFWIEREVLMTAHEGSEHAEQAERRDIGEATLEQFRADVTRLAHEFMTGEPFPLLREMRRVRNRMYAALDRRLWPRDATELYFLVGTLNCLMAVAAEDLGYSQAGEELVRAAWAYATAIDHRSLLAKLRLELAQIASWPRPRQARDLAANGLEYLPDGPIAAYLNLQFGRSAARLGDAEAARRAISDASEAREREHPDDLLEIGGEFDFSRATQHYMGGSTLVEIPGAESEAITELERAAELYAAGPEPGETHGFGCEALTHIDLATARLRTGEFDGAVETLGLVLSLPVDKRINALPQRLSRVNAELANQRYQGSPQARTLEERIEEFSRDTIVRELHSLPAGPG